MKKALKIVLSVFSTLSFLWFAFWVAVYYIEAMSYVHYTQSSLIDAILCVGILVLILAAVVFLIIMMFKPKKVLKIVSIILLIMLIPLSSFGSFLSMAFMIIGPNGCSYTQDISDYGTYDNGRTFSHFPDNITDDMTVVDFSYYYKYADRDQTDLYLEIKFDDKETMEKHLNNATIPFLEKGVVEYQNPYNDKYTDVILWKQNSYTKEWALWHSNVAFEDLDSNLKSVNMFYPSIIYSYEELTVIYNYTDIGNDIFIGDDPDEGFYYPKILKRFGVECDYNNDFSSKELFETEN